MQANKVFEPLRKQRRVDGKKQNYIVCSVTGAEFASMKQYNQYKQSESSSKDVQRFNLTEQVAYSYMRNRSTEDKAYAVSIMQRDQNKAYKQVQQRKYWAKQAMDTDFNEEVHHIAWDSVKEQWYSSSKEDCNAVEVPTVHYLVEDYLERLLRHSELIVVNGGASLSRLEVKSLLSASDAESYRWYNAVQDAQAVCSAEESDVVVPF